LSNFNTLPTPKPQLKVHAMHIRDPRVASLDLRTVQPTEGSRCTTTGGTRKGAGAYYTPDSVVRALMKWAIRQEGDRFLDPSCGDGRFICRHRNSVGIERDAMAAGIAARRAPNADVYARDFFDWAATTPDRFHVVGGNPPFIRYQTFKGDVREGALALCRRLGARFSGLTSSWAPFLVASTAVLERGGRIAFVVPAEIGHAPYAAPVLEYLAAHFEIVHVVAYQHKLFPDLSEDCWLLYAEGFGGCTRELRFTALARFEPSASPPSSFLSVSVAEWQRFWNCRLRPFILPNSVRQLYLSVLKDDGTKRLKDIARVGIGYVTGDNDFFHLRPSKARQWNIPARFLRPTVRKSEYLTPRRLTTMTVERWQREDDQVLLLTIPKSSEIPSAVSSYLQTEEAEAAAAAFKCRTRSPWYSVPDVQTPEYFLTYMAGMEPSLVRNDARCTCTNSVHAVTFRNADAARSLTAVWDSDFLRLSCEIQGHPLGGGMLKLEPGEAGQILVPTMGVIENLPPGVISEAIDVMRQWRHYASKA
jgi:adenine-specific DNA methylase